MKSATSFLTMLVLAGCAAHAAAPVSDPPPRHDFLESPAKVKTPDLQYGQGGDYERPDNFAPIVTAPGPSPTAQEALNAFRRADLHHFSAYQIRIFACAPGALNGPTGRVDPYPGKPVVQCSTVFFSRGGQRLGELPVNYYYWQNRWNLRDPETVFAAPRWANLEPTLPRARGKAVK